MQQVYSNVTKVMVDSRAGSNLLYLPLDRLLQQAGAAPAAAPLTMVPAPTDAGTAPATGGDIRSRDGTRTREREGR
jgi:membrane protease subunit HflK